MKKLILPIIIITILLFTSGCFNKTKITAEEFKTKMNEEGLAIAKDDEIMKNNLLIDMYIALKGENGYQIEFYEFKDKADAIDFYDNNKEIFNERDYVEKTIKEYNGINYNKYIMEADNYYKNIIRVDNTNIYLNVKNEYKDEVKNIIDKIGY